ncbi:MAG: hypothetical protein QOD26_3713 [Betaproteobacteria bacterium]|jgi:hypothetical protein|nr:hypothetical protein [Betaproteobacteria bacterium]
MVASLASERPKGIGGWLLLPAIGLCLFPPYALYSLAADYWPIFQLGMWGGLTTPGSGAYHPLWAPTLVYGIAANVVVIVFDLVLIVLLFRKSPRFPKAFVVFALLNLAFVSSIALLVWHITGAAEAVVTEVARSAVVVAIWLPYMLLSKRVRNTFRAGKANSE